MAPDSLRALANCEILRQLWQVRFDAFAFIVLASVRFDAIALIVLA